MAAVGLFAMQQPDLLMQWRNGVPERLTPRKPLVPGDPMLPAGR